MLSIEQLHWVNVTRDGRHSCIRHTYGYHIDRSQPHTVGKTWPQKPSTADGINPTVWTCTKDSHIQWIYSDMGGLVLCCCQHNALPQLKVCLITCSRLYCTISNISSGLVHRPIWHDEVLPLSQVTRVMNSPCDRWSQVAKNHWKPPTNDFGSFVEPKCADFEICQFATCSSV